MKTGIQYSTDIIDLAYNYAFALKRYIYRRSIQEGLRWFLAGVVACQQLKKESDEATLYNDIGVRHWSQGNYSEALKWYEKSLKIFKEIGSWHSTANLLENIGILYRDTGKKDKAKQYLQESYQIHTQLNLKSEAEEVKQMLEGIGYW